MLMIFGKKKDFVKISFNCPVELAEKIEEIKDVEWSSATEIIVRAVREYGKKFDKKMSKLDKLTK